MRFRLIGGAQLAADPHQARRRVHHQEPTARRAGHLARHTERRPSRLTTVHPRPPASPAPLLLLLLLCLLVLPSFSLPYLLSFCLSVCIMHVSSLFVNDQQIVMDNTTTPPHPQHGDSTEHRLLKHYFTAFTTCGIAFYSIIPLPLLAVWSSKSSFHCLNPGTCPSTARRFQ